MEAPVVRANGRHAQAVPQRKCALTALSITSAFGAYVGVLLAIQDSIRPLETIELRSQVEGVMDWWEGFEELKAIPHSFAIALNHGQGSIAVFMDSATDKVCLVSHAFCDISLISSSAGILHGASTSFDVASTPGPCLHNVLYAFLLVFVCNFLLYSSLVFATYVIHCDKMFTARTQ